MKRLVLQSGSNPFNPDFLKLGVLGDLSGSILSFLLLILEFIDKQNHDLCVKTTDAAIGRHDMPQPEIPC